MRRLVCVSVAAVAVTFTLEAQQPSGAVPALRGDIVDAATGVPLRRARISVASDTLVFTDDQGRFTLATVPGGSIPLKVTKAGYVAALIPPRAAPAELRIPLTRGAAINGRVVDRYGRATPDTFVTATLITQPGDRTPSAARQFFAQVDGVGEYRVAALPAGRYQVRALKQRPGPDLPREELLFGSGAYVDAGTDSVEITLEAGDEMHDVNFRSPGAPPTCGPNENLRPPQGVVRALIRGRVTDVAGVPVPCVSITVTSPTASVPPGESDDDGNFVIYGLAAGTWSVTTVYATGYVPLLAPFTVTLRAGEERERVQFVLQRQGAISGTVVDEHGEPLEGIRMTAFTVRRYGGRFLVPPAYPGEPTTDDRGRYRLVNLQPGRYLVAASASGPVSDGGISSGTGYAPVYYPNSPDLSAAVRLAIEAGQELRGIDIGFVPTPTFTVAGRVLARQGPVPAQVTLALSARTGVISVFSRSVEVTGDGAFAIRNVPPGDYVLQAQERPVTGRGPFAVTYVRITDAEPAPVVLVMVEPSTIEGRIVLETTADLDRLQLALSAISDDPDTEPLDPRRSLPRQLYAEGTGAANRSPLREAGDRAVDGTISILKEPNFRISGLTGRNRFSLTASGCRTCYIKSASVNGSEATDQPFDVGLTGESFRNVEVVISDKGAIVQGRVLDKHDAPLEKFTVVVFSPFRDRWYHASPYVRSARSASDGTFTLSGLPPGDYLAASVRPEERAQSDAEVTDAAVLDPLIPSAQRLTIREGDRRSITLRSPRQ